MRTDTPSPGRLRGQATQCLSRPGCLPGDRLLGARAFYMDRLGLRLTPLEGKRPFLPNWQDRALTPEELDGYVRNGRGLGCVHGPSGTATLDADAPEELVTVALAAVGVDFPALLEAETPAIIGNPAKPPKKVYRVPEGYDLSRRALRWPKKDDPKGREVVLELRAGAVQDVLPPTDHPDTGAPYRWTVVPRRREDLPLVPGPLLGLWLAWDLLLPRMEAACPWAEPAPSPEPTRPPPRNVALSTDGPSIIETWNERVPVSVVLDRNGYKPAPHVKGRWISPDSTTGTPGVVLCDSGRVYTFHESDPLAGPHAHDAFGLLTVLEHGGDAKEAAQAAARELGLEVGRRTRSTVAVAGCAR